MTHQRRAQCLDELNRVERCVPLGHDSGDLIASETQHRARRPLTLSHEEVQRRELQRRRQSLPHELPRRPEPRKQHGKRRGTQCPGRFMPGERLERELLAHSGHRPGAKVHHR
jgi:hypothetical protein